MSVIVILQAHDGKFKKNALETAAYGAALADVLDTQALGLSLGAAEHDVLSSLGNCGLNKVLDTGALDLETLSDRQLSNIVNDAVQQFDARALIFAHTNLGKALAPRLAVKLKAAYVSGVTALPMHDQALTFTKMAFTGKAIAKVAVKAPVFIATLSPNTFEYEHTDQKAEVLSLEVSADKGALSVLEVNKHAGKVLLSDAEIVVSGGRGLKGPENWPMLEEMAEILGAATACSRPVSDDGWRPHSEHVGQTGKIIAPNLYFALGISGAIQHLGGVSSSKVIVAVNKDREAPIFEAADYGIVGDVMKVVPQFIEALKN